MNAVKALSELALKPFGAGEFSFSFILFYLGRIAIVLLLPSLAISIVTGIPVETSILIMGILCVFYETFGGVEAVIWTNVMQVVVLLFWISILFYFRIYRLSMYT